VSLAAIVSAAWLWQWNLVGWRYGARSAVHHEDDFPNRIFPPSCYNPKRVRAPEDYNSGFVCKACGP